MSSSTRSSEDRATAEIGPSSTPLLGGQGRPRWGELAVGAAMACRDPVTLLFRSSRRRAAPPASAGGRVAACPSERWLGAGRLAAVRRQRVEARASRSPGWHSAPLASGATAARGPAARRPEARPPAARAPRGRRWGPAHMGGSGLLAEPCTHVQLRPGQRQWVSECMSAVYGAQRARSTACPKPRALPLRSLSSWEVGMCLSTHSGGDRWRRSSPHDEAPPRRSSLPPSFLSPAQPSQAQQSPSSRSAPEPIQP
jgi:hypothetical protein